MNSCVLMAQIVESPQLRYTKEGQPITDMVVQFTEGMDDSTRSTLRAIAWGDLATEVPNNYQVGDRVVLQGSLRMNLIEREGFKEKRAELNISRIYRLDGSGDSSLGDNYSLTNSTKKENLPPLNSEPVSRPSNVVSLESYSKPAPSASPSSRSPIAPSEPVSTSEEEEDLDDIPF